MTDELHHLRILKNRIASHEFTNWNSAFLVLLSGTFIAFRLWHPTRFCLYSDEIFSVETARHTWGGLITFVIEDVVHPPLFYMLLKAWIMIGGESLLWLRLLPILAAILSLIPFFLLCRELRLNAIETNFALILVAVNPYLVYYSQELRMYSLVVFFSTCSAWLFVKFLNSEADRKRNLLVLTVVNLLLVYTHYYGFLIVGAEGLFLIIWNRKKLLPFLHSTIAVTLCFLPWIYFVAQQAAKYRGLRLNLSWNEPPTFGRLIQHFSILSGPLDFRGSTYLRLLLFGIPVLIYLGKALAQLITNQEIIVGNRSRVFWLLFLLSFLPVVVIYSSSLLSPYSGWLHRSLIVAAVPYMLLIAVAVNNLRPGWIRFGAILAISGWVMLAGIQGLQRGEYGSREGDKKRIAWNDWAQQLTRAELDQDSNIRIYAFDHHSAHTLWYYLGAANDKRFQIVIVKDPQSPVVYPPFAEMRFPSVNFNEVREDHFWIASKLENCPSRQSLMDKGYRIVNGPVVGIPGVQYVLLSVWKK